MYNTTVNNLENLGYTIREIAQLLCDDQEGICEKGKGDRIDNTNLVEFIIDYGLNTHGVSRLKKTPIVLLKEIRDRIRDYACLEEDMIVQIQA